MPAFQRKYSDDQRTAVRQAWAERGIRPARRIVELAAAGELTCDSEIIPAFEITQASVRSIGEGYARALARSAAKASARRPADTIETLRRRFVVAIDAQLSDIERRQARRKYSSVKPAELQGIGRMLRELAALPGPDGEPAKGKAPGARVDGANLGGATRGGLAGQLLATVEPRPIAAPDDASPLGEDGGDSEAPTATTETDSAGAAADSDSERINVGDADAPGEYARAQIARMRAGEPSAGA